MKGFSNSAKQEKGKKAVKVKSKAYINPSQMDL